MYKIDNHWEPKKKKREKEIQEGSGLKKKKNSGGKKGRSGVGAGGTSLAI